MSVRSMLTGLLRSGVGGRQLLLGWQRGVSTSLALRCDGSDSDDGEKKRAVEKEVDPAKDRRTIIPVETSLKYMQSEAYQTTYGNEPVWQKYRRNFKGAFAPKKTRKTCIRAGIISTGNPCPVCRDEYLVLDPINVTLLKQFISPHNNAILPTSTTNLCQKKQQDLQVAIHKARDRGLLTFEVPFRHYHYPDYYPPAAADSTTTTTTTTTTTSQSSSTSPPSS